MVDISRRIATTVQIWRHRSPGRLRGVHDKTTAELVAPLGEPTRAADAVPSRAAGLYPAS